VPAPAALLGLAPAVMKIQKILLPTDFSLEGERALPAVAELAATTRATVLLLHVVEVVGAPPAAAAIASASLPNTKEELARARMELEKRRTRFPKDVEVVTDAIVGGSVAQSINDYAVKAGCDLIAVSTHGRTGFRRLIMGSIAESVLRHARVPVLAFPRQT